MEDCLGGFLLGKFIFRMLRHDFGRGGGKKGGVAGLWIGMGGGGGRGSRADGERREMLGGGMKRCWDEERGDGMRGREMVG